MPENTEIGQQSAHAREDDSRSCEGALLLFRHRNLPQCLAFGVWGLGFGVLGVGFGV